MTASRTTADRVANVVAATETAIPEVVAHMDDAAVCAAVVAAIFETAADTLRGEEVRDPILSRVGAPSADGAAHLDAVPAATARAAAALLAAGDRLPLRRGGTGPADTVAYLYELAAAMLQGTDLHLPMMLPDPQGPSHWTVGTASVTAAPGGALAVDPGSGDLGPLSLARHALAAALATA